MQPIVLKIANSEGYADYADGLEPNTLVEEDIRNLGELGTLDEPLLTLTLNLISGTKKFLPQKAEISRVLLVKDPLLLKRQRMIIEKEEIWTYN